tara:strand:- start:1238 stop:2284 length:1047 start_codon:yes stop_codon:yes gene_type:complete
MLNYKQLKFSILSPSKKINDALKSLNKSQIGVIFICQNKKLLGVISDGDIRRRLIKSSNLDITLDKFFKKRYFFAKKNSDISKLKKNFFKLNLKAIPIIDSNKKLIGAITRKDFKIEKKINNLVFILAGGKGLRMRPLTKNLPKPMIKIGNSTILERQLKIFKKRNFNNIVISTNYLAKKITKKFNRGHSLGLNISYVKEKKELETAGPLSLLKRNKIKDDFIIINGDIVADLDFYKLIQFHKKNKNDFTVCAKNYFYKIPYGLIENKNKVKIKEKPTIKYIINSGIYVCSPKILKFLKYNKKINMTDFINHISQKKLKIKSYLIYENIYDFTDLNTYYKILEKNNEF